MFYYSWVSSLIFKMNKKIQQSELTIVILTYDRMMTLPKPPIYDLLTSLSKQKNKNFNIIILYTSTINEDAKKILSTLIKTYHNHLKIRCITTKDVQIIHHFLVKKNLKRLVSQINLKPYANARNFGLIISKLLGSKLLLFLDDDEVIPSSNFISDVRYGLLSNIPTKNKIYGKTGYCLNQGKTPYMAKLNHDYKRMWPSIESMNKVIRSLINSDSRMTEAKMALGGVMALSEHLFSRVPFDPFIPRGEDTDYLINSMQFKMRFVADNKMGVYHYPRKGKRYGNFYQRFKMDMARFIYEREKVAAFENVNLKQLEPYPAIFLKDDLEYRAIFTSISYATRNLERGMHKFYNEHMNNIRYIFRSLLYSSKNKVSNYIAFQKDWEKFMAYLDKDKTLAKSLIIDNKF